LFKHDALPSEVRRVVYLFSLPARLLSPVTTECSRYSLEG
jgi:hypothetical protein